jgi:hypothetical protein
VRIAAGEAGNTVAVAGEGGHIAAAAVVVAAEEAGNTVAVAGEGGHIVAAAVGGEAGTKGSWMLEAE